MVTDQIGVLDRTVVEVVAAIAEGKPTAAEEETKAGIGRRSEEIRVTEIGSKVADPTKDQIAGQRRNFIRATANSRVGPHLLFLQ